VLVGREAGGGKSRIVAEFTERVRDRALVLAGGRVDLGAPRLCGASAAAADGERDTAATRLTEAVELAAQLGSRPLLKQITRLARRPRFHVPPAATGQVGPALSCALTSREIEMLRLVTDGLSNQKIAAELFISPRTASVHVSNILGKLGVACRTETASTAYRLHLFDPS